MRFQVSLAGYIAILRLLHFLGTQFVFFLFDLAGIIFHKFLIVIFLRRFMAIALASSIGIRTTRIPSSHQKQVSCRFFGLKALSIIPQKRAFPSVELAASSSSTCSVFCAANPETLRKVCQVVKKQLALSDDDSLTPETNFSALGADSLDTMEIVMALEEEFKISVGADRASENIATVQEAANMIDKLLEKEGCCA